MARASYSIPKQIHPIRFPNLMSESLPLPLHNSQAFKFRIEASSSSKDLIARKSSRTPRRLISIATSDGKWNGKWSCDYLFTLEELQLADLAEDGQKGADVSITLTIEKHASFGFSVGGRIITSFMRKCSNCSSSYCREVIYVKPGSEADLDSLIQDTIRLASSTKETCSELCEKTEQKWQYIGSKDASIDGRWSRLLQLRDTIGLAQDRHEI